MEVNPGKIIGFSDCQECWITINDEFSTPFGYLANLKELEDDVLLGGSEIEPLGLLSDIPEIYITQNLSEEDFEKVKNVLDKLTKKAEKLLTDLAMATGECIETIRSNYRDIMFELSELLSDPCSTYYKLEELRESHFKPKSKENRKINDKYNYIPNFKRNMPYHRRFYDVR